MSFLLAGGSGTDNVIVLEGGRDGGEGSSSVAGVRSGLSSVPPLPVQPPVATVVSGAGGDASEAPVTAPPLAGA